MNPSCNSCSDEQLWNLLQADDVEDNTGDRQKATAAANHLAECPHCQSRIEQLAAEPAQWLDIRDSLQPDQELDADKSSPIDKSKRDQPRWGRERWQRPNAWTESMAKSLLSPASHPEMLGRIGRYDVERLDRQRRHGGRIQGLRYGTQSTGGREIAGSLFGQQWFGAESVCS